AACQENIVGDIQIPNHPLVNEVMKDVLTEAMDIDGLKRVLRDMNEGRIRCIAVDTPVPSQFSHEILNANPYAYLDDAPLEERRARAVEMRRMLPESVLEEVGKLDPAAINQVRSEAWPDVRDADELHDVLHTLVALVTDWMSHIDPTSCDELGLLLGIEEPEVEKAMLRLEASGAVLRRKFTSAAPSAGHPSRQANHEWCDRHLLARIHRLTVAT